MSQSLSLDTQDLIKIGKGALLALAGALAGYLTVLAADWKDSPGYAIIAAAVASTLANVIRKWIADNSKVAAAILLAILCSIPGMASAELKAVVSGPNKLKPDIEYTLSAKRSTDAIQYEWSVLEKPDYDLGAFTWDNDKLVSVMFDTPGEYTIRLRVVGKPDVFPGEKMLPSGPYNPAYVVWLEDRVYGDVKVITESVVDHKVVVGEPKPGPTPGPQPGPVDPAPSKVDRVTFVYEKSKHPIPLEVAAALSKLNTEAGILATSFEQDSVDGDGDTPDQYKIALEAAKKAGLPCLVVQSGSTVYKIKQSPKTAADVTEAIK